MNVVAAFALEKVNFSPFFEATNARFPFQFAAAVRTRVRTEAGKLHGVHSISGDAPGAYVHMKREPRLYSVVFRQERGYFIPLG